MTGDFSYRLFFPHILKQARLVPIGLRFDLGAKPKIVAPRPTKSVVTTAAKANHQSGAVNGLEFGKRTVTKIFDKSQMYRPRIDDGVDDQWLLSVSLL